MSNTPLNDKDEWTPVVKRQYVRSATASADDRLNKAFRAIANRLKNLKTRAGL